MQIFSVYIFSFDSILLLKLEPPMNFIAASGWANFIRYLRGYVFVYTRLRRVVTFHQ